MAENLVASASPSSTLKAALRTGLGLSAHSSEAYTAAATIAASAISVVITAEWASITRPSFS